MTEKKKHPVLAAIVWLSFIGTVILVCYLSFQDGEKAKLIGNKLMNNASEVLGQEEKLKKLQREDIIYLIRQFGRAGIFFLMGVLGTTAVYITGKRKYWFLKTVFTATILLGIAYLTEKLKIYIPSRHYSYEEMMISIVAVSAGFLLVSIITLCIKIVKSIFAFFN